jgi:small subunit ribosomal protein S20
MISEAYKAIDKTVKVGAMHRNTGDHRKSRLARRKKAIEILRGWYVPNAEPAATAA